jgi:endogenous inhibitor of DNA gyrase (YacG/DUF329 family)
MTTASTPSLKVRIVPCPACGGPSRYATDNPWRPFCSARCKNQDFGAWASENYRVATQPSVDDEDGGAAPSPLGNEPIKH